jgi:NAD(P)-dependent dehydrogenase (short-subunit alcohol dehydrogenase family)
MNNAQKIALVTGGTRGIGLETVRQLAQAGVHTLLAGRDRDRAVEAALKLQAEGLPVEAIALDVTDAGSIDAAVATVRSRHGRLDILVNNAGIAVDDVTKKPSEQGLDVWRRTFDTNLFGLIAVTNAFLPLIRSAPAGRIVNVSSLLASITAHLDPTSPIYEMKIAAYDVSKTAVNAWTVHLAHELRGTPIKVNTIHPGYVQTEMNYSDGEQRGEISVPEGAKTSVRLALIGEDGPTAGFFYMDEALPW